MSDSLDAIVGPCADKVQRVKDLYVVNTVSGWVQNQLRILGDMAHDHGLPEWYVAEVRRIHSKIETVTSREDQRSNAGGEWSEAYPAPACSGSESGKEKCEICERDQRIAELERCIRRILREGDKDGMRARYDHARECLSGNASGQPRLDQGEKP